MTKKKKKHRKKGIKKSLKKSTHPIPTEKVEPDKTKYDRRKEKEKIQKQIKNQIGEDTDKDE
ncbi:MAG: hypothetical protein H8E82_06685 [Candidatus Marinimicrobia bacterium]|nr:hypothetical protein [Candidatus Neomarinimicrobiota bacterium]MBL7047209.1 hypothetical protein [Candidatus Neomarinimicrobiota bacterium]